jgi:hypothetical protein
MESRESVYWLRLTEKAQRAKGELIESFEQEAW